MASQREVTHNHGRGAVGRAVGGGRQEEAAAMVQWDAVADRTRVES